MDKIQNIFWDKKTDTLHYINDLGYEHCNHVGQKLIPVATCWGNQSFICFSCGQVVKKELTSTSL